MSRYPGNPRWTHGLDVPIMILDEASWNEAVEAGHLTAEHVLARLENMAEYEFANGAELGLAPGGTSYRAFLRSLLPPEEPA